MLALGTADALLLVMLHDAAATQTIFTLPQGALALGIARACRATLVEFLNGSPNWGKQSLARWLLGPYSALTSLGSSLLEVSPPPSSRRGHVEPAKLRAILADARAGTIALMRAASLPDTGLALAYDSWRDGAIAPCEDESGAKGWLPLHVPGMRLRDRVRALWAIDYLMRPEDYKSLLCVCPSCDTPVFDALVRARGGCCTQAVTGKIRIRWMDGEEEGLASVLEYAGASAK